MTDKTTLKTEYVPEEVTTSNSERSYSASCPVHPHSKHSLSDCYAFVKLPYDEKKTILEKNGRCFRCLGSHMQLNCNETVTCSICNDNHHTSMHCPGNCRQFSTSQI